MRDITSCSAFLFCLLMGRFSLYGEMARAARAGGHRARISFYYVYSPNVGSKHYCVPNRAVLELKLESDW